jgi:hypothetical protein
LRFFLYSKLVSIFGSKSDYTCSFWKF